MLRRRNLAEEVTRAQVDFLVLEAAVTRTSLLVLDARDLHALMEREPPNSAAYQRSRSHPARPRDSDTEGRSCDRRARGCNNKRSTNLIVRLYGKLGERTI